jgi:hypothetical protein
LNSNAKPIAPPKFGEIGGHGGDLAHHPHGPDHGPGELRAAQFRQIAARNDAEFGRQRLE